MFFLLPTLAILAQAISCSNGSLLVREPSVLSCVFVARRRSMPRKGWTQIEVPHGWTQLIRGVRPRSEKWPRAERNLSAAPGAGSRSQVQRGRWRQPIQTANPEESALAAFGDSKGPEVTMLQESLRSARRAVQVPPLGVQLAQCEQFVTRAQKRLAALDEERVKLVSELEEGQARLQRLRVETAQRPQETNPTAPVPPGRWKGSLTLLTCGRQPRQRGVSEELWVSSHLRGLI